MHVQMARMDCVRPQVTFGETINLNLAQSYRTLLLTQNMTAIFGSNPSFLVKPGSSFAMGPVPWHTSCHSCIHF